MKAGDKNGRKPTLIAMSRTVVELADELASAKLETESVVNTASELQKEIQNVTGLLSSCQSQKSELKAKVTQGDQWRSDMQKKIVVFEQDIETAKTHEANLTHSLLRMEKHRNQLVQTLSDQKAIEPALAVVVNTEEADKLRAVIQKIYDETGLADQVGSAHAMEIAAEAREVIKDLCRRVLE